MALTAAQHTALREIAAGNLHVGADPGNPYRGTRFATRTLRILIQQGLIARGPYQARKGRTLTLTDQGRAVLNGEA